MSPRLAALALAVAACVPAHAPVQAPHTGPSALVEDETVALLRTDDDGSLGAYCSGVWVAEDAVLTAAHCVEDKADGERVSYAVRSDVDIVAGDEVEAQRYGTLAARDVEHDLALVRVRMAPAHATAHVAYATVGQFVQTEGHPLGLWWSYSSGQVAALRMGESGWYVQSTAPISPGNSGGGLFDADGNLLGVCQGSFVHGENLNLFIDARHVEAFLTAQGVR